jgi:transposase-like protein
MNDGGCEREGNGAAEIRCPDCEGTTVRNGLQGGRQRYRCIDCRRQFIPGSGRTVSTDVKRLVLRMIETGIKTPKIYAAVNGDGSGKKISLRWIYELKRRMER